MWLVDVHCHSAAKSPDSSLSIARAIEDARAADVDALCLTEHDAFWRRDDLPSRRTSSVGFAPGEAGDAGVVVVPGAEINTDAGHVLVFGLESYEFGFHHAAKLAEAVERAGGAMVLAHPYRRVLLPEVTPNSAPYDVALRRALDNPLLRLVDAVEVANGRALQVENLFSSDLARAAGLRGVAGSDSHEPGEAGRCVTEFDQPVRCVEDLIRALKSAAFRFRPRPHGEWIEGMR